MRLLYESSVQDGALIPQVEFSFIILSYTWHNLLYSIE